MRKLRVIPAGNTMLLIAFVLGVFALMVLPMLLMGYHYNVPYTIKSVRLLVETSKVTDTSLHMLLWILSIFHHWIRWENVEGWVTISIAAFCLSLMPLWWCVRMLFDRATAWVTIVIFSMLPLAWINAHSVGGHGFAYLPLFIGFGFFLKLHANRPMLAMIISGAFFGITMATQHSYIAFLPFLTLGYIWHQRKSVVPSIIRIGVFCAVAYAMFLLPMIPGALQQGLSVQQRIAAVFEPMQQKTPGEGHLYPDEFLYEHYKVEYDAEMQDRIADSSFLKRQEDKNYRIIFGTDDFSIIDRIASGTWMLLNNIPQFFMMDFMGGAFLWLFIMPGILVAWKTKRILVLYIGGIILSMEFVLRYVLLFTSSHIDNYLWAIALFAGIGVVANMKALQKSFKWNAKQFCTFLSLIVLVIALQLLQVNRKVLARLYTRSPTLEIYAATESLKALPEDAVIAAPRRHDLLTLSDKKYVSVHEKTIDFLEKRGKLAEPFALYGVTNIIGYSPEDVTRIKKAVPSISVIELNEKQPELSTLTRYLLNMIR